MANLNYSHTEGWAGIVLDVYFCTNCGSLYSFKSGTAPYIEKCEDCGAVFEGADFNDQIGGKA